MNKIIPALSITVLCSCSTTQVKTPSVTADIIATPPAMAETAASQPEERSRRHLTASHQFRHHAVLNVSKSTETPAETEEESVQSEALLPRIARYLKQGIASWYGPRFHGKKTATGEIFDMYALTAAHKTLPIPSWAEVTNLENNRKVIVRINDRGPFVGNRLVDLSYAAAQELDMNGLAPVEIKAISAEQAIRKMRQTAQEQQKQGIYLQVGTFKSARQAYKLRSKIAAKHLAKAKVLPSHYHESTFYTVQVGPLDGQSGVDKLNLQLSNLGITGAQYATENDQNGSVMIQ
ncbi:septal ring lytic transglycosylase RlpA family protein [Methylomicrobium sp. Wu6]|uniref:septal ring lytic transglycosylase RlpA family protein n=1 Tax=Methylomicrobium sp. Wu6 TaxID=3107928 RepID=UPI002DD6982F|nr:septal ring lytic transglycosylase RlpA family protein [Methylomicrobium sp. Wu6]MEC4750377.1 septal ring lytic transglycosylase RlpA family protein [Methylomicrobium sp. Wu6]